MNQRDAEMKQRARTPVAVRGLVRCIHRRTAAAAVLLGFAAFAGAHWVAPGLVPVSRLVENLNAYTKEHPRDGDGFYRLGRTHSLAFTLKSSEIRAFEHKDQPPDPADRQWGRSDSDAPPPTRDELREHLVNGIAALDQAIRLKPGLAHCHLSMASLLESGADWAGEVTILPGVKETLVTTADKKKWEPVVAQLADKSEDVRDQAMAALRRDLQKASLVLLSHRDDADEQVRERVRRLLGEYWRERAATAYLSAYQRSITRDLANSKLPLGGLSSLISHEAGSAYVRIIKTRGPKDGELKQLAMVEQSIEKLEKIPKSGAITPIVLSLEPTVSLNQLIARDLAVPFDLDGTTRPQQWPWLKPSTGLLCWDPANSGRITSGRQLFGSVSWWLFFRNGYEALDALDDNRDGSLAGPELRGISIWFDRNSNAISDPGEVTPVQSLGIRSLSCRATATSDGCPANPTGLTLADGRSLPTYDWIAEPLPASESDKPGPRSLTPLAIAAAALFAPLAIRRRHA